MENVQEKDFVDFAHVATFFRGLTKEDKVFCEVLKDDGSGITFQIKYQDKVLIISRMQIFTTGYKTYSQLKTLFDITKQIAKLGIVLRGINDGVEIVENIQDNYINSHKPKDPNVFGNKKSDNYEEDLERYIDFLKLNNFVENELFKK